MITYEANSILANFADISRFPRNSGSEKAVSDYIKKWAEGLGLDVTQDELGNLIIKKAASPGCKTGDAVILQAHMDMVCEKSPGSPHDFSRDPINPVIDGDWLTAEDTSLGADNGIGVAIAMSILEADSLKHPPLEVIFTVQEETTFEGAAEVDKSGLKATRMINLDHACGSEVIIGSCGGTGVNFEMPIGREASVSSGFKAYKVTLSGLVGGHSGEDIHRGRGNAISLIMRFVEKANLPLVSIDGGSNRLAIPREASAVIMTDELPALEKIIKEYEGSLKEEYVSAAKLRMDIEEFENTAPPLDTKSYMKLRLVLRAYPNGIIRMFDDMEGIVESSDNIGIIETSDDSIRLVSEVRGSYQATIDDILETIKLVADFADANIETFSAYSPWKSAADSELKRLSVETYRELFGEEMKPVAVHAGLESAFFASAMPELDIISIGPDCQNFHSTEERVSISSTLKVYKYLVELLSKLTP